MSDTAAKTRELLIKKLRGLATRSTSGALNIGAGVVGQIPFYVTIGGLAITFLANALIAFQQDIRNNQSKQEPYFIAIMAGLGLFVFGLLLSLNALSDLITYIQQAAEIGSSKFVWRTPEEEILRQSNSLAGLPDTTTKSAASLSVSKNPFAS